MTVGKGSRPPEPEVLRKGAKREYECSCAILIGKLASFIVDASTASLSDFFSSLYSVLSAMQVHVWLGFDFSAARVNKYLSGNWNIARDFVLNTRKRLELLLSGIYHLHLDRASFSHNGQRR